MKKDLALLFLVLILSLTLPSAGIESYKSYGGEGICHDKFDMVMEPHCNRETCNGLCDSKKFDRLYTKRCLDSITCECTHRCPRP
ncbi:hypothetical protein COLO4_36806 [Corchorus olitorius]|uniref:S locus-related glycoprotein 1 binding pollen coat n=1 Tax=Corchorus olitorius TaxID=93759 RepID=A0A1R3G558_9ROSI|nr:hypothetical protein COLO4_36806 [Corchorus olitorius]